MLKSVRNEVIAAVFTETLLKVTIYYIAETRFLNSKRLIWHLLIHAYEWCLFHGAAFHVLERVVVICKETVGF